MFFAAEWADIGYVIFSWKVRPEHAYAEGFFLEFVIDEIDVF